MSSEGSRLVKQRCGCGVCMPSGLGGVGFLFGRVVGLAFVLVEKFHFEGMGCADEDVGRMRDVLVRCLRGSMCIGGCEWRFWWRYLRCGLLFEQSRD